MAACWRSARCSPRCSAAGGARLKRAPLPSLCKPLQPAARLSLGAYARRRAGPAAGHRGGGGSESDSDSDSEYESGSVAELRLEVAAEEEGFKVPVYDHTKIKMPLRQVRAAATRTAHCAPLSSSFIRYRSTRTTLHSDRKRSVTVTHYKFCRNLFSSVSYRR